MTDDQTKPRSSLAVWLIVGLFLLPVAYVLSVGPASYWISEHGSRHPPVLRALIVFYKPLEYIHGKYKPFDNLFERYVHL